MGRKIILAAVISCFVAMGPTLALAQQKKAKPSKVTGDVGLLDLEKNYMIVVTKEGKLVTIEFSDKTRVTKYVPHKTKVGDLGLGDAAAITYQRRGDKNVLDAIEVKMKAKKGE